MSKTIALGRGGFKEVRIWLNWIGTRILEVCERSRCVADQCFGSGRLQGGKLRFNTIGTRFFGSL